MLYASIEGYCSEPALQDNKPMSLQEEEEELQPQPCLESRARVSSRRHLAIMVNETITY